MPREPKEKTKNEKLLEAAQTAIQNLHGDTSVSIEKTIEGLRTLQEEISTLISACENDLPD